MAPALTANVPSVCVRLVLATPPTKISATLILILIFPSSYLQFPQSKSYREHGAGHGSTPGSGYQDQVDSKAEHRDGPSHALYLGQYSCQFIVCLPHL